MATKKKQAAAANDEATDLLKKILVIQLFQLDVPQAAITKKVKLSINVVNDLLKGIKKRA
jgi:hypothetical protein